MDGCRKASSFLSVLFSIIAALLLVACGGGGGGDSAPTAPTTTISGKVSLSSTASGSTVSLKARPKAVMAPMMAKAKGKPFGKAMKGSQSAPSAKLGKAVQMAANQAAAMVAGSTVNLYDADHPEWLYPVSTATTDANGQFKLSQLINASLNGASYSDNKAIPAGNYTLIAIGKDFSTSAVTTPTYPFSDINTGKAYRNVVAVQSVVQKYEGDIVNNDLEVQASDAVPQVVSIMGKKTAGLATTAGGEYDLGSIAYNAAIQVTFDMAMHRVSTPGAITLKNSGGAVVAGTWKMSPDLTAATFYPASALTQSTKYTLTVSSTGTANYYGKGLKADVNASFTAAALDTTKPNAIFVSPDVQTGVDIVTAIKFAANEPMDINTITVSSTPSIGAKPTIQSLGFKDVAGQYDYTYQIVPTDPLQLNTDYAITVSGGTDLAGNAMTSVTVNFKTAATSSGVTGTGGSVVDQTDVKTVVGTWVDSMNAADLTLFSSMLSGDFSYDFVQNSTNCDLSSSCYYDTNKDGVLSYSEFTSFIKNWFNNNSKVAGWTGDSTGVHLSGDVVGDILVDSAAGTAAFQLDLKYLDASGALYTGPGGGTVSLYLVLRNANGAWYVSSLSDKDITGVVNATTTAITAGTPSGLQATGTRSATFTWTPVAGATSYAVVLLDNADPTGSTGWLGIIDGQNTSTLDYSSVADMDPADGKLVMIGGSGLNAPFSKELKLQDGGSYTWIVLGFKSLTAATFISGTVAPDADMMGYSSPVGFSIDGAVVTSGITVTPKASTGVNLSFSDPLYAWDAGAANSVTLDITATSAASTGGMVYVYGTNYAETSFAFVNGKATVTVDLFNGYNWIDVYDGMNWWYATPAQTNSSFPSNYVYTTGGVVYNQLTVDSVSAGASALTLDAYGYYNIPAASVATTATLKGKSQATTVYIYNSAYDSVTGNSYYSQSTAAVSGGAYTATVDIYSGYNWISVYDGYGNWAYVNIYNAGSGAVYQAPVSNVTVGGIGPDGGSGTYWTVNATSLLPIAGTLANAGDGYWYQYSDSTLVASGTITNTAGAFNVSILPASGNNYVDLYDANWNWLGITIFNQAMPMQANSITSIDGVGVTATAGAYYNYLTAGCSVTVQGSSPASANSNVYVYLYSYGATGASVSDYQTVVADGAGNYAFSQSVYTGSNYIDVYDANWNWQGVLVESSGACVPTMFGVTSVSDGNGALVGPDAVGDYYVNTTSVTISGTAASGKTVSAYVSGMYSSTYSTVAGAANTYTINFPLDAGWNYVSLTDGSNWYYLWVNTSSGAVYTPPISNVTVSGATLTGGGGASDSWSDWSTSLGVVDITGTALNNGTGYYYRSGSYSSASGSFTVANGAFSLPGLTLDNGWNYVDLYDVNGGYYSLWIYTTGGQYAAAKVVTITSPQHNSTVSGAVTVTGTIDTAGFTPVGVMALVWDDITGLSSTGYWDGVTDPVTVANMGYVPITYAAGSFSMPATVVAGNATYIEVMAVDANNVGHGHWLEVNNTLGYSEGFYKPGRKPLGSKPSARSSKAKAHQMEFKKKLMSRKAK